jgi:hypothetical protein
LGKHSRELHTGLNEQQRIDNSIAEKARQEEADRRRHIEVVRQLLALRSKRQTEETNTSEKGTWVKAPEQ